MTARNEFLDFYKETVPEHHAKLIGEELPPQDITATKGKIKLVIPNPKYIEAIRKYDSLKGEYLKLIKYQPLLSNLQNMADFLDSLEEECSLALAGLNLGMLNKFSIVARLNHQTYGRIILTPESCHFDLGIPERLKGDISNIPEEFVSFSNIFYDGLEDPLLRASIENTKKEKLESLVLLSRFVALGIFPSCEKEGINKEALKDIFRKEIERKQLE